MCQCPSCKETDALAAHGFGAWPKGDPAGKRSSTIYAQHVSFGQSLPEKAIPDSYRRIFPYPVFPSGGTSRNVARLVIPESCKRGGKMPILLYIADIERANGLKHADYEVRA